MAGSHTFEDHTGEVLVRLAAPALPALFDQAALALAELLGGDLPRGARGESERVELHASDLEALLVEWLDELIYRGERARRIYRDVHVNRIERESLVATVRGDEAVALRTAVKAATWHRLRIASTPEGVEATVVLDV